MFEMSTGRELDKEVPEESDYDLISGGIRDKLQEVITFIFSTSQRVADGMESYKKGLEEVSANFNS